MDTPMDFELTMRLIFGKKAYHIAGAESDPVNRRQWLKKAIRRLLRHVDDLDTTVRHKQMLMSDIDELLAQLKSIKEPSWAIVYRLLRLCFRLFGYDYVRGAKCHTPVYWQTEGQYYTSHILEGGDVMEDVSDKNDAISVRHDVVMSLNNQGLSDFKIALVLNTTEYAVKQLRKLK